MEMIKPCHLTKLQKWLSHKDVMKETCVEATKKYVSECEACENVWYVIGELHKDMWCKIFNYRCAMCIVSLHT